MKGLLFLNELWLAYRRPTCEGHQCPPHKGHHRPPHKGHHRPPRKGTVLNMLTNVQIVNGLRPSNKWPVRQRVFLATNSHVRALLVNARRKVTVGRIFLAGYKLREFIPWEAILSKARPRDHIA